jgi:hypothetical protein
MHTQSFTSLHVNVTSFVYKSLLGQGRHSNLASGLPVTGGCVCGKAVNRKGRLSAARKDSDSSQEQRPHKDHRGVGEGQEGGRCCRCHQG